MIPPELTPIELIIYGLAVYRFTLMVVDEDGVFHIFERIRRFANFHSKTLSEILSCKYCASVWVSMGVVIGIYLAPVITWWGCIWLAFSGFTVLMVKIVR